jgi:integrase
MSDATEYTVQKFRGGYALVWREIIDGESKRRRKQLQATDRPSAEAEARGEWETSDGSPWTVGRIMTGYLASITEKSSYRRRKDAWKAMRTFWENVTPALIDDKMCQAYRKVRKVADATVRYELLQLSTALGWAKAHIGPKPSIWLPAPPEQKLRHLTRDEFRKFSAAVKADHAKVYVAMGLNTVARPSAILDLTWDRVDFMRRQIDYRPPGRAQTSKRRIVVHINDALLPVLQSAYAARSCEYVIERGGKRVANVKKAFQAASKRSAVHATPYTLRHTGAVWAAEAGVPMSELAQMMGHDDDRTTQKHYARYSPGYLAKGFDAISEQARGSN